MNNARIVCSLFLFLWAYYKWAWAWVSTPAVGKQPKTSFSPHLKFNGNPEGIIWVGSFEHSSVIHDELGYWLCGNLPCRSWWASSAVRFVTRVFPFCSGPLFSLSAHTEQKQEDRDEEGHPIFWCVPGILTCTSNVYVYGWRERG